GRPAATSKACPGGGERRPLSLRVRTPVSSQLRPGAGTRRDRGQEHLLAWTKPAGTRGDACGEEPSTRWALAQAECQLTAPMLARYDHMRGTVRPASPR